MSKYPSATEESLKRLQMFNAPLPKTDKEIKAVAIKMFVEKLGHEYVDVPIASDAKGSYMYSRFSLRNLLTTPSKGKE